MQKIDNIISYIDDQIWCTLNLGNPPADALVQGCNKLKELIENSNYNIDLDLDENGNNALHQIVESGYFALLLSFKLRDREKYFELANKTNNMGLTPFDTSKLYIYNMKQLFKMGQGDLLSAFLSSSTNDLRKPKEIIKNMEQDNLRSNGKTIKENYKLFFSTPLFENIPAAETFVRSIDPWSDKEI